MKIALAIVFAALGMLASVPPSAAILFVCPTDSPGPCAAQELLPFPDELIELYVQGSNGVDLTIEVSGGVIKGFVPYSLEGDVVEHYPNDFSSPTTQIHIVGVRANPTDPPATTFRLGTLTVDASSRSIIVAVAVGSEGVAAGDVIEVISPEVIPEPAQWLMLVAGSSALAAFGRRRSRQAKRRV